MSIKRNLLAASLLCAVTGTTASALIYLESGDAFGQVAGASGKSGSNQAGQAMKRASNSVAQTAIAGIGTPIPAADAAKAVAIARAEQMLKQEKMKVAKASGKQADASSLAAERYTPSDVVVESDGSEHVRMDRTYRDLPVIGGDLVVHSRDGNLLSTTKTLDLQVPDASDLKTVPKAAISQSQAVLAADKYFDADLLKEPSVKSVYYAKDNQPVLAYEVELMGSKADRIPLDKLIYIDANTGEYLAEDSKIFTVEAAAGNAFTLLRGKVSITTAKVTAAESPQGTPGYLLQDPNRGNGKTLNAENKPADSVLAQLVYDAEDKYDETGVVTEVEDSQLGKPYFDADNLWGDNQVDMTQRIGAEVHYGVEKTWDYYKQRHDRNGIANDGKGVRAVANMQSFPGQGSVNAFWASGVNSMFYLNGEAGVANPVIALDVAGHEMTHGVTAATAKLIYSGESGGLNEANSDIMGTMVEFFDNSPKDPPDYLIGEAVLLDGPLRYMFKPSLDSVDFLGSKIGSQDCYDEPPLINDPHYTSGVGNHFFYLLSEGAVVPAGYKTKLVKADLVCNGNTNLTRITNKVAAQIWYRATSLYMTSQTDYPKAREATQQAAADLLDRGLLNAKQVNAVACAWDAVNVPLPQGSAEAGCH